jgi:hypothetical protein
MPGVGLEVKQRRWLVALTVLFFGSLLALYRLSVVPFSPGPEMLPLFGDIGATQRARATATPPAQWPPFWYGSSTAQLGEEPGPTSTPKFHTIFLPIVAYSEAPVFTPTPVFVEPPPAPPTPDWPTGLDRQTNSKLSLHAIRANNSFIMEFIRRVRPRVVKSVDDVGWLAEVKQASPNTLTIGRFDSDQLEEHVLAMDPAHAAELYINAQLHRYRANPGVDVWEGWNEFVPINNARMAWFASFEAYRVCRMQQLGLRAAVGGFSVGVPEYDQMAYFLPALEAAWRCNGIFTLHEYNSPTMDCGVSSNRAGIIPGAPNFGDVLMGYHTLRYRFWYEGYLKPRGMGALPLVISEAGIEGIPSQGGCEDPPGRAWQAFGRMWVERGYGPNEAQAYVNLLAWYDAQLRQDSYVLGATLFTVGTSGEDWSQFELHEALIPLARYATELE